MATKKQKLDEVAKFDGNLISLYLYGMIGRFKREGKDIKDVRDYLEHMKKIDPEKEGKDFWNAVHSLLKKLHKKELGENKMAKKKQKLDEGLVMISSLLPVGPKLTLSMRGDKPDNFVFKGLPGQFDKDGNKIFDEWGDPIRKEEFLKEADSKSVKELKKLESEFNKIYKRLQKAIGAEWKSDVEDGADMIMSAINNSLEF